MLEMREIERLQHGIQDQPLSSLPSALAIESVI